MIADSWDPGQYAKFLRERSAPFAGPGLRFERGKVESFVPDAPFDLVFSNAALHFVEGHGDLLGTPKPTGAKAPEWKRSLC